MAGRVRVLGAVLAALAIPAVLAASSSASAASSTASSGGRVAVIGVPGLLWSDVSEKRTPTLWRLAGEGSAGSMSIRTVGSLTCPIDGWLTVSAGNRAGLSGTGCGLPPVPTRADDGVYFPDFAAVRKANAETQYAARVGLLGEAIQRSGGCTMAIGPGAAVAAADPEGRIDVYRASIEAADPDDWSRCPLTVVAVDTIIRAFVDAGVGADGETLLTEAQRAQAVQRADRAVARAVRALPPDTTVLIAGVSDADANAQMHVAIAAGPSPSGAPYRSAYLTSNSTRQPKIVQLTDIAPTVLRTLDVPVPDAAVGSPWLPGGARAGDGSGGSGRPTAAVVESLRDVDRAAQAQRRHAPAFYVLLVVGQLMLYGLAAAALRRRWADGARTRVLAWTRRVALAGAALPIASFLADLVPWWRSEYPGLALAAAVIVADAAILALALGGPWRRHLMGPVTVVAGVTAVVLAIDVITGARLELSSLMGYSPVVGGRFYGFGNPPYALFAAGFLLAVSGLAEWLRRGGRMRLAVGLVVVVGAVAVAIDGWPAWGSDLGGVIALIPGFVVLGLLLTGRRITVRRMLMSGAVGIVVVSAIAIADYLGPRQERSHLGRFVGDVLAGSADTVILRKFSAMLGTLGNFWLALLVPFAVFFLVFVLLRPAKWRAGALQRAYDRAPGLRAGMFGVLVTSLIGFAVNDSGLAVPAVAAMLVIPLALAASIRALELDEVGADATTNPIRPTTPGPPPRHTTCKD